MAGVAALGYIGWEVKDILAWEQLMGSVFGLELREDGNDDAHYYRLDDRHHRITLYPGKTDSVRYIGWEVESAEALASLSAQLKKAGVNVVPGTPEKIQERAVMDMICLKDPDQLELEIYYQGVVDYIPFKPSRAISGFNTGEMGLGHIVIACADLQASTRFYQDLLGFRLTDYIYMSDDKGDERAEITFMHCNPRHHSLAIVNACFGLKGGDFNHLMLEAKSIDDVGTAYDRVNELGIPVALTLGKHTNDKMTSFYLYTPSGWQIEYGWGGVHVDDSVWQPKYYTSPKIWGHDRPSK
ncbi:MAG: 2,3-dihydroxybiphenyl 1,2-dioxygenase [Gammaproteobacteria bacterium]|jgi:2,3-dihydroxybiphenyl 1,2-dioxygenase